MVRVGASERAEAAGVELTTAVRFFAQYGQASPAQVMRLALAARADSTGKHGVPSESHTRENVLSAGAMLHEVRARAGSETDSKCRDAQP